MFITNLIKTIGDYFAKFLIRTTFGDFAMISKAYKFGIFSMFKRFGFKKGLPFILKTYAKGMLMKQLGTLNYVIKLFNPKWGVKATIMKFLIEKSPMEARRTIFFLEKFKRLFKKKKEKLEFFGKSNIKKIDINQVEPFTKWLNMTVEDYLQIKTGNLRAKPLDLTSIEDTKIKQKIMDKYEWLSKHGLPQWKEDVKSTEISFIPKSPQTGNFNQQPHYYYVKSQMYGVPIRSGWSPIHYIKKYIYVQVPLFRCKHAMLTEDYGALVFWTWLNRFSQKWAGRKSRYDWFRKWR